MEEIKIKSNEEFLEKLQKYHEFLENMKQGSIGLTRLKITINEIYQIVNEKKIMIYKQKGYSYFRAYTEYQDTVDFFKTDIGEEVTDILFYFAYKYNVSKEQLGGYNTDPNFNEDMNK